MGAGMIGSSLMQGQLMQLGARLVVFGSRIFEGLDSADV